MKHANMTLALAAIIAVIAVTAIGFAIPQQALAHRYHHSNGIKVDQQINQANICDNGSHCINEAQNNFGPQQPLPVWK